MPQWLVVGLDSGVFWPTKETAIFFRGHKILLRPEKGDIAPSVVLAYDHPMTWDEALLLVREFLSSLAWVEGKHIREIMITGGSHPINVGKSGGVRLIDPKFRVDYLPDPDDPKARLALALYREALNVNSIAYEFLGFFKIINVLYNRGPDQEDWINKTVDLLENYQAKSRLVELRETQLDIGKYLYESGRCAVAHAFSEPLVNPEDPEDARRLQADLPLIKALAEYLIEHELGVRSQITIWRQHLYELDGFRTLLGAEIVTGLKDKKDFSVEAIPRLPRLSIRLRNYDPFPAFEKLDPQVMDALGGRLLLNCRSHDGSIQAQLSLNFAEERLEFDPDQGVKLFDNGLSRAARNALDRVNLIRGLYTNAQIEVWNADQGILLGRCDPFLPVNIDPQAYNNLDQLSGQIEAEVKHRELNER